MEDLPYRSLGGWLRERCGCRVHKVSLDAGFGCPHRERARGAGGCIFCSNEAFSRNTARPELPPLRDQLAAGIAHARRRFGAERFIAYFQAFSSTWGRPPEELRATYDTIREFPAVIGLAVGTRPDCVPDEVLRLLASYREEYLTWLELGLQSACERSLEWIGRGHGVAEFVDAVRRAHAHGLPVTAHLILGLPEEGAKELREAAELLTGLAVEGVKLHALHVVEGSRLAAEFHQRPFPLPDQAQYAALVCDFLERIPADTVVHRLAVDVPRAWLIAPAWCLDKAGTVRAIEREFARRGSRQGCRLNAL